MACVRALRALVTVTGCSLCLVATAADQPHLADRVVSSLGSDDPAIVVHPHITQSHFRFLVAMLARSTRTPIGFEEVAAEPAPFDGSHEGDLLHLPSRRDAAAHTETGTGLTVTDHHL
jgi:hypothetical protein